MKKYHYYYWFAFPAFTYPKVMYTKSLQFLSDALTPKEVSVNKTYVVETVYGNTTR